MDGVRFDRWTRRRVALATGGVVAALAGAIPFVQPAGAKKKRKNKLNRNQFGCVDVGGRCRGKDKNCCSGICQGKKPKKGEKDKSRCVAHHVDGCQTGQDACVGNAVPCGTDGICVRTTGGAGFCGASSGSTCTGCAKDTECEPTHGPGAACVVCTVGCQGAANLCFSAAV